MRDSVFNREARKASFERAVEAAKPLVCSAGNPWYGSRRCGRYHCVGCARIGLQLLREFREAVERGEYDEQGYTPLERAAQERARLKAHGMW